MVSLASWKPPELPAADVAKRLTEVAAGSNSSSSRSMKLKSQT
jgi:hypothetical protein